jgi:hypothetical protein
MFCNLLPCFLAEFRHFCSINYNLFVPAWRRGGKRGSRQAAKTQRPQRELQICDGKLQNFSCKDAKPAKKTKGACKGNPL